jgi:hypothetical protein
MPITPWRGHGAMFMRICSRCHRPREVLGGRVLQHKFFLCADCIKIKETRRALESR